MTLDAIMVQFQCMNALLDTPSDELCQVNTHVDRITRWQARLGGFVESPSPSPEASEDDDDDSDDEMSTCYTYHLSLVTKMRSSFGYESSHTHKGRVSIGDFC